ncbi:bifunctional K:H/Na:H antiporter NHX1 [Sugiyamaella lignohabitans]|uniref:Bifunctional K:H/Na:H antiporter NHX1 n=1 Tax=Sugiyamaella lignohabitans TaxID=796027 RepID=A0A167BZW6_9ASCO|nr:bifunctional K:H/Na:H antiporter NHX1 [Sugiyamaella lignohabitans]ANB11036.1 bifunctional K:H/Na:H antiporter NHX1 [Sugiyamaella lignohabitans]
MTALVLKHSHVRRFPQIESCLVLLFAYASYFFSNGCHMSGIVSLLFCGITLKHYAYYNMSRRTQIAIKYIFQLLAQLSENFIFVYLGLSLFTQEELIFKPVLIIVTALGICVSRWAAVFPLSKLINFASRARATRILRGSSLGSASGASASLTDEIPQPYQMMLFWAGLRGAVGVALAAGLEGEHGPSLRATVLVIVVLTVIVFGGTTARMLEILGIRTGVIEDVESDDEFDIEAVLDSRHQREEGFGYNSRSGNLSATHLIGGGVGSTSSPGDLGNISGGFYQPGSRSGSVTRLRRSGSYHDDQLDAANIHGNNNEFDSDVDSDVSDLPPMAGSRSAAGSSSVALDNLGPLNSSNGGSGASGDLAANSSGTSFLRAEDRARWFREFDEQVLKPVLLDSSPGANSPNR